MRTKRLDRITELNTDIPKVYKTEENGMAPLKYIKKKKKSTYIPSTEAAEMSFKTRGETNTFLDKS